MKGKATLSVLLTGLLVSLSMLCVPASCAEWEEAVSLDYEYEESSRLPTPILQASEIGSSSISMGETSPLGKNVNLYLDPTNQDEPTIALNPQNPAHLAAGSHDQGATRPEGSRIWAMTYRSLDGGKTWSRSHIPREGPLSTFNVTGDPVVDFDGFGNTYFSGVAYEGDGRRLSVWVAKSADGGLTYDTPIMLDWGFGDIAEPYYEANDKPWIATDKRTTGTGAGNVYVMWTSAVDLDGDGNKDTYHVLLSRSTDSGATFSAPLQVSDPTNWADQLSQVAVDRNGEVYVSWCNWNYPIPGRIRILFDKSTDYGESFGTDIIVHSFEKIRNLPYIYRTPPTMSMAVDTSGGVHNGYIYIAYPEPSGSGDDSDMMFTRSIDEGSTWSTPIRLNDDLTLNDQFFPAVAVDPLGSVKAAWYDRRLDAENRDIDVYFTESNDGGSSFATNTRATDVSFDPAYAFIGDYIDIDASSTQVYPVWTDRRNGNNDIYTLRTPDDHDLSVTSLATSKTVVGQDYSLNISVTLANPGRYAETSNLTVYADANEITTFADISLDARSYMNIVFEYKATGLAKGNYTISAVADTVPDETDTTDNTFVNGSLAVAMIGDITGPTPDAPDGKVDVRDIALIAKHFGQSVPPAPANCDITGPTIGVPDGKIDIRDIATVAKRFGQVDP